MNYSEKIEHGYGKGWKDRRDTKIRNEKRKELFAIHEQIKSWSKRVDREKNLPVEKRLEALDKFEELHNKMEELKKELTLSGSYADQSIEYKSYVELEKGYSIAEVCGRFNVDKNRVGFAMDKYNDNECADKISEGSAGEVKDITDFMDYIETNAESMIKLEDILQVSEDKYDDDRENIDIAFDSIHYKHLVNAENREILNLIVNSIEQTDVNTDIRTLVNSRLCSKAKAKCEIWTNADGFALLDQRKYNETGLPMIEKNGNGELVFDRRFIIREFPNEILPNTEKGAPVLIGDWKNLIKFALVNSRTLSFTDVIEFSVKDREIAQEIPILTSTSDKAYINGFIPLN